MQSDYTRKILDAFFGGKKPLTDKEVSELSQDEYNELWQAAEKELVPFD